MICKSVEQDLLAPAAGKMGDRKKGKQIYLIFVVFRKCTRDVGCVLFLFQCLISH